MSTQQQQHKGPKVLKFLNDYRKQLALLKTKSFYANHLCKVQCLQRELYQNRAQCMQQCDNWLDRFFQIKHQKNPDKEGAVLLSSDSVPAEQRMNYEKTCAKAKIQIKSYLFFLDNILDQKINECSKKIKQSCQ